MIITCESCNDRATQEIFKNARLTKKVEIEVCSSPFSEFNGDKVTVNSLFRRACEHYEAT